MEEEIEEQKTELFNWKKKLKYYLSINTYKQEEFFLISKYWFENYKNNFLHLKLNRRNSSVLFDEILDNNNELFTTFTENKIDISNLPKIFVLNKTIWFYIQYENQELNSIAAIGYYSNKLLTLKVLNLVYCFLFLDQNMQIRQGYLEIIKKKNEDNIIKEFKQKGFFDFIKKDKKEKEYNDNIFQIKTNNYKMIVFKSFFKEEDNKKIIEKDDYEKQIIQRKRAKTLRQSINIKDKNIDESKYFFGNKLFTIKKTNKIDEKEKMGKIEQLFKNFFSLFIVKKEKEENKILKEIIKEEEIKKNNSIKNEDKKEKNKKKEIKIENKKEEEKNKKYKEIKMDIKKRDNNKKEEIIKKNKNIKNENRKEEKIKKDNENKIEKNEFFQEKEKKKKEEDKDILRAKPNNQKKSNFNIFESNPIFKKELIKKSPTPGIIGLKNIGATCYMNATIQCFSNIFRFRDNLLYIYIYLEQNKDKKILSFSLAEVFYNLWQNLTNNEYAPYNFKDVIGNLNPLFKGVAANDPKDLILFLLETMHKELNNPPKKNIENNYLANCQNFNSVFNEFIKDFTNNNNSIICQEFYGCSNSMTTCGYCLNTIHNVQALNILFFPLEEVRKFINKNRNSVKIEDCFLYYQKQDIYPSFYCNNCRQLYAAYNQSKLVYTPPTIIINLNRGRGIQYDVKIEFEEYLNIRDFVYSPDSPNYYELIGVICHFGTNDMGGHFIAFCKNSNNLQWYKYNDGEVNISSFSEIKQAHLPYVLFYSFIAT